MLSLHALETNKKESLLVISEEHTNQLSVKYTSTLRKLRPHYTDNSILINKLKKIF